jgi:hypothetical protein
MCRFKAPTRRNKGNKSEGTITDSALVAAKASCEKTLKATEAAKLTVTTKGVKPFELYGNLLYSEAWQPWEKSSTPK